MPTTNSTTRFFYFRQIMLKIWLALILALVVLGLARLLLYISYTPQDFLVPKIDILKSFLVGARFDAKLYISIAAPLVLLAVIFMLLPKIAINFLNKISIYWLGFGILIISLLAIINHFYFGFYQSPINVLVFGFIEDDTEAIMRSLWHDFPLIKLIGTWLIVSALLIYLLKICAQQLIKFLPKISFFAYKLASIFLNILLVALLARGSIGTFPLNAVSAEVSANTFVNQTVLSGGYALYNAWRDRESNNIDTNELKIIKSLGFNSATDASQILHANNADEYLWTQTPANPQIKQQPPNVVLAIMEAWGRHLLEFDNAKTNDLLGALRPWLQHKADYFKHAISYQNGTHPSLEGFLLDSPITPLTQVYGYVQYLQSMVLPYKKAGYRTIFVTAGSLKWRSLGSMLRYQGFAEAYGAAAIMQKYPQATMGAWGIEDEYMFKFAEDLFNSQDKRPIFLMFLSITNHPPYSIPKTYKLKPIDWHQVAKRMNTEAKLTESILETYQYANDSLGNFLNYLEASGKLANTLFAATGDHNTRSIFLYADNSQLFYKYGVPILMYIPAKYRGADVAQSNDWVAHQDIMPTLYNYSLSDTKVPRTGRNLYQPVALANAISFISEGGTGILINKFGAATNFANPHFYKWNAENNLLIPTDQPAAELQSASEQAKAWLALRDWRVRRQLQNNIQKN